MSTDEEIHEVFYGDIDKLSKQVKNKRGIMAFYEGIKSISVYDILTLDEEDQKLLSRILENNGSVPDDKSGGVNID